MSDEPSTAPQPEAVAETAPAPSFRTDRARLVVLMAPKPGMSDEDFDRHWLYVHGPLFASIAVVKRNLLKYEQHHLDPKFSEILASQSVAKGKSPFRGVAIFEAESLEKIFEVFQDEEYRRIVIPDEHKFFDHERAQMLAGPFAALIDK